MVTQARARRRPGRAIAYNPNLRRKPPMNNNHQLYRDRRSSLLQKMRTQTGGGLALVPTAPETCATAIRTFRIATTATRITCPDFPNRRP